MEKTKKIAVIIPCYRVRNHIIKVLKGIGKEVNSIYCIDDCCPENSGQLIKKTVQDKRLSVLFHNTNQGVGGATMTGYKQALADGADIIVKLDGDGQMDPSMIAKIIRPVSEGIADYTKGNRFYDIERIYTMPLIRIIGNSILSFMAKLSTGYWTIFDPTNGYTAIHAKVLKELPLKKISKNYFFETDILFRLNIIGAVVADIPMRAIYASETSSIKILRIIPYFILKHLKNFLMRIFYNYFLRSFSIASCELLLGLALLPSGILFGLSKWHQSIHTNIASTAGTVMLAALPIIIGFQLLLSFLNFDIKNVSSIPLQKRL